MTKTAYITTPIYYPSGAPHLGSAYTSLACDVYSRFKRLDGYDTKFLTGTDEHGLKIQRSAELQNKSPQEYVDGMAAQFRELTPIMNLSNDDFIRTTEERHIKTATAFWKKLEENGYIYKDTYSGWYSVPDETYYTEDELVNGCSPDSGHPVEWVEEESYYFKLSAFQDKLLSYYDAHPEFIQPKSRFNEVYSFVKKELRDLSISRSTFTWGVPVPNDDAHIMYVWIDALTNYLSATGWPEHGDNSDFSKYWPAIHVVGKDILKFHAIYWPAMLMAANVELPKQIFAHGWWTVDGEKMSKSKGNVVNPAKLIKDYGRDQLRYFLMREVSFGNDGDFSKDRLIQRINTELANDLGNLFQRVLTMVYKNCDGKIPALNELTIEDKEFLSQVNIIKQLRDDIDKLAFHNGLNTIWHVIGEANRYMDTMQPWKLKDNPERMAHVLRVLAECLAYISLEIEPFMPESAKKMQTAIALPFDNFTGLDVEKEVLITGTEIPKPQGIFPRIDVNETEAA
jgi:methionyl-tRNA synthetase